MFFGFIWYRINLDSYNSGFSIRTGTTHIDILTNIAYNDTFIIIWYGCHCYFDILVDTVYFTIFVMFLMSGVFFRLRIYLFFGFAGMLRFGSTWVDVLGHPITYRKAL